MTDTTFITNQNGETLLDRFKTLVKDTKYFDCLVGYFYASGFASLSESLKNTEKIRILIGLSTDKETYDLIQESQTSTGGSIRSFSNNEIRNHYSRNVRTEMDNSDDTYIVEKGVRTFIDWIRSNKLEIKAYPSRNIHAKVYIMKFQDADRDYGRVITGSSNFSYSGLESNLEFNVELKEKQDYEEAHKRFEDLWKDAVDVSEAFVSTIDTKTWLSGNITPYELYLKYLYEALKEQINQDLDGYQFYLPEGYLELQYQKDAVTDAVLKLEKYNGVFISDVVGLGKTYITSLLLKALNDRAIILAPPTLIDRRNPGSWPRVLEDFGVSGFHCDSVGKLDTIGQRADISRYKYVVIDEAHKFRNENTQMYENLYRVCVGKKIILVTATPLNNSPKDILSQIKLFQPSHKSTFPNPETKDLEKYFGELQSRLAGLDRETNKEEYLAVVRDNAERIRKDILQHIMVRRTRSSIVKYYKNDMDKQHLKFPDVADPEPLYYSFDKHTDDIFNETIENVAKKFKYARYAPLLYLKDPEDKYTSGQKNMMRFMRVLLLKRLESSFYAFRKSLARMIYSYERFINEFERNGFIYTGDSSVKNLMKLMEEDRFEEIEKLVAEGRVQQHMEDEFKPEFLADMKADLKILKYMQEQWDTVTSDPKGQNFIKRLREDTHLNGTNKVLIFTEAKETADYLTELLGNALSEPILNINGSSSSEEKQKVIDNFDGKVPEERRANDYRILVATEVLSEGVNLHRSNVVINYDIPWNPVRMIQRVGRVNRVGTQFDKVYTYNFFPTGPIDQGIGLSALAEAKIEAFIEMLGNDAKLLTDEEIKSHDLFNKLMHTKALTEDEDEDPTLQYLKEIRDIRDTNPSLFERIKDLPKKARVARSSKVHGLLTFFRKGRVQRIFFTDGVNQKELDFVEAARCLKADENEAGKKISKELYEHLNANKEAFRKIFLNEYATSSAKKGTDAKVLKYISAINTAKFTDEETTYIQDVINAIEVGTVSKYTLSKVYKEIQDAKVDIDTVDRVYFNILRNNIDYSMIMRGKYCTVDTSELSEVILSEYFGA